MRKLLIVWLVLFRAGALHAEEVDGFRNFTDTGGRTFKARLTEFNSSTGKLHIETDDGKEAWVAPSSFSSEDHGYIREWVSSYESVSQRTLKVSIKKESAGDDTYYYVVTLRNMSDNEIGGLTIEYRYFCQTIGYKGREDKDWVRVAEALSVGTIPAGEKISLKTLPIQLKEHTDQLTSTEYEAKADGSVRTVSTKYIAKVGEDRLLGVWLKLFSAPVEGTTISRDLCEPKSLDEKVEWK